MKQMLTLVDTSHAEIFINRCTALCTLRLTSDLLGLSLLPEESKLRKDKQLQSYKLFPIPLSTQVVLSLLFHRRKNKQLESSGLF